MLEELLNDNEIMLQLLNKCFDVATQERQQGVANFMADRISQHGKFGWQLRSFLKEARA